LGDWSEHLLMCLASFYWDAAAGELVLLHNRDEVFTRATTPAAWLADGIVAGIDCVAKGTWLGVSKQGRFAFLTNIREPETGRELPEQSSRGEPKP
jgi:uncharacterized protein with NRDE domain